MSSLKRGGEKCIYLTRSSMKKSVYNYFTFYWLCLSQISMNFMGTGQDFRWDPHWPIWRWELTYCPRNQNTRQTNIYYSIHWCWCLGPRLEHLFGHYYSRACMDAWREINQMQLNQMKLKFRQNIPNVRACLLKI